MGCCHSKQLYYDSDSDELPAPRTTEKVATHFMRPYREYKETERRERFEKERDEARARDLADRRYRYSSNSR